MARDSASPSADATKVCPRCGRTFSFHARWRRCWDQVVYCGERCRRTPLTDTDRALEAALLDLATARGRKRTLCPSEAARQVAGDDFRSLMEPTRAAARRLVAAGLVDVLQKGRVVDPSRARGPIRVRLRLR